MSEDAEPRGAQRPPPGAGGISGMPPPSSDQGWNPPPPSSAARWAQPGGSFPPGGTTPSAGWAPPGGSFPPGGTTPDAGWAAPGGSTPDAGWAAPGGSTPDAGWGSPGGTWGPPAPGWGVPPPARPPRSARVHVIWLVVVVVAALGCGTAGFLIGKSSAQIGSAIKSGAAAAGAAPCRSVSSASGVGARLAGRLLPLPSHAKYLKGRYRHQVDSLDQFVSTLYAKAPYEKGRLVAQCFRAAAQQGWVLPSGRAVTVYLIQFGTAADARSYTLATQSADLADPRNGRHGTVGGVSDGMLIEAKGLDKYGNTQSRLIGDKGDVAIIIHVFVAAHLPSRTSATSLLRRQAARL